MDDIQKQLILRYAQLSFKQELGQNGEVEREKAEIREKLGMTHDEILWIAAENISDKFN